MTATQESEDPMIILACVVLVIMFIVTVTSASLWFCNCCSQKSKPPRNRSNHYSLSMRGGCEFDNPQGTFARNPLTAQLSPTIRVTSDSIGALSRSASYEVCTDDPFTSSLNAVVPPPPDRPTTASSLLASLARRLASLGGRRRRPLDADRETSVDRELGASSTDGKFDSLVLSMQWSDLTEAEASPEVDGDGDKEAVIELVRHGAKSGLRLALGDAVVAESCPAVCSPDGYSFKSFGSEHSFYSVDGDVDSTSVLFRSCSYDGIPQSSRRSSCL